MIKHIPNFITSLNLFSGCVGVYFAFQGSYPAAFLCIMLSAVFDFLDGFAARLLKAYSEIGKQLDSLADMVSFGFLPGALVFSVLLQSEVHFFIAFIGFLIPIFSAFRLAKFNVDERQTTSFLGLPTPANAIFWGGLIFSFTDVLIQNLYFACALAVLFCLLLVSEIPMFSLKINGFSWKENKIQYIFLLGCVVLIALMQLNAFAPIIAWYIVFSIGLKLFAKKHKK
jgi:CDP-diacylglycerol--serine O-phosphatidyltransferase